MGLLIELIDRPDLVGFLVYYGLAMFGLVILWMVLMAPRSLLGTDRGERPSRSGVRTPTHSDGAPRSPQ